MTPIYKTSARNPHNTKSGPGRFHREGPIAAKERTLKQQQAGQYGKFLRDWITAKNIEAQQNRKFAGLY